jgi:hypothetical protein
MSDPAAAPGAARRNRTPSGTSGPNGLRSTTVGPIRAGAFARTVSGAADSSRESGTKDTRRP